jgi:hypothetical protein
MVEKKKTFPCTNCITLSICKATMNNEGKQPLSYKFMEVINKCELLKKYIKNSNFYYFDLDDKIEIKTFMEHMFEESDLMYYKWKLRRPK